MQAATIAVEDLELDATPEDLMLSYVSGEKGKVRARCSCHVTALLSDVLPPDSCQPHRRARLPHACTCKSTLIHAHTCQLI